MMGAPNQRGAIAMAIALPRPCLQWTRVAFSGTQSQSQKAGLVRHQKQLNTAKFLLYARATKVAAHAEKRHHCIEASTCHMAYPSFVWMLRP